MNNFRGRLTFSNDGVLRRTLRASHRFDEATCEALAQAARRDKGELPTLSHVLDYCLKLGIEMYLAGQPDEADLKSTGSTTGSTEATTANDSEA